MLFILHVPYIANSVYHIKIDNITKWVNFSDNNTVELVFGLLDGGKGDEHNCVGFVETSKIFAIQHRFSFHKVINRRETIKARCELL